MKAANTPIEREAELERLALAVEGAAAEEGAFVVVRGSAGIGKSLLLETARERARERGLQTLRARGGELERDFAYGVVRQLLERATMQLGEAERAEVLGDAAALAAPVLSLQRSGEAPTGGDAAFAVTHGLYWLVSNLAARRPLVLEVDDAHWADAPSLRFLVYLAARLEGLPVLLMLALRPDEPGTDRELLAQLDTHPDADVVRPGPLSDQAVTTVIGERLDAEPTPEFAAACGASTGGNPFLLHELLLALSADGVDPTRGPERVQELGPETVARSLLLRLARLPPESGALARAVAVLGARADLRHAAELAGIGPDAAGRAADALASVEILEPGRPLRFAHPVVREAIYADLPSTERMSMHARAARVLAGAERPPAEVAPHLLLTEPAGDPETVQTLRDAAAGALDQGAPDLGARLLGRALAEPPVETARAAVLGELGTAEWLVGGDPAAAVAHLAESVELSEDGERRGERALVCARAIFSTGDVMTGYAALERELTRREGATDELTLRLEAELASIGLLHPPTAAKASARLERFTGIEGTTVTELMQIGNLAFWKWLTGTAGEAAALAERAARDGRLYAAAGADSLAVYQVGWVLTYADRHELALETLDAALADARARGSVFGFTVSSGMRAFLFWRRGDVAATEAEARNAAVMPEIPPFSRPTVFYCLAFALIARGELDEAEWAVEQSGAGPHLPEFVHMNPALYARALLRLAQDRPEEALADLDALGERDERLGVRNPGVPWRVAATEANLRMGNVEEAVRLADLHAEQAANWGTNTALGVALLGRGLAAGGDAGLLARAAETLAASPSRLDHARALVELGAALRRDGLRSEAQERLREAVDMARACGATALMERAHEELVTAGARPRRLSFSGVESLTASERRVAEMAASGQSNREIAQGLFLTVKTVENHLSHVYTKLGVRSRLALPEALGLGVASP